MATRKLKDIAALMSKIDICMMTTENGRGTLSSRPMSNNGDVEYDGDSYFFSYEGSRKVKDLDVNANVELSFSGKNDLYISISGKGKLIRDKEKMKPHWIDSLKQWFEDGLETEGIVLIQVKGASVKYWQNEDQGEIKLS